MELGNYTLHAVRTGTFRLDGGAMFGIIPKPLWERSIPSDDRNRISLATRSLLIMDNERRILIDNGCGEKWEEKYVDMYGIDYSEYHLQRSLSQHNLVPEDITDLIITHLHFDHCGGTTYSDGDNIRLTFPNAVHHISKKNWEWANNPTERDKGSYIAENFSVIDSEGKLNLVDGVQELFPGIRTRVSNGHTKGQQLVEISGGTSKLVYCGDLIPTSAHIPLPYIMGYDLYPLSTLEEKKKLLGEASENDWILFFEHDPAIAACRVKKQNNKIIRGETVEI